MRPPITAATRIAGVVGAPVRHSLSPLLHNGWIEAAGLDAVYLAFEPDPARIAAFLEGQRGGVILGLNVTIPFKEAALAAADRADGPAEAAGAANLLLFHADGAIEARNTDGEGLIDALNAQAPALDLRAGPSVIFGAGGAARGAAAALRTAGAPEVRVVNRTAARAVDLAARLGAGVRGFAADRADAALEDAVLLVNATSVGLGGGPGPPVAWTRAPPTAVAMDMIYRPIRTGFLAEAAARGLKTVDGLDMLIGQAVPSFHALFGIPPPQTVNARGRLLAELEHGA